MTIALPAEGLRSAHKLDLSWPVLMLFAALLCVLIILPMSWLVYYSFVDRDGDFHAGELCPACHRSDLRRSADHDRDHLDLIERDLLRLRGPDGLAGGAHRHAAAATWCGRW